MTDKNQKIIVFITGTSGAGKSVLVPLLKKRLPSFAVYDFDELGVPENVDLSWRLDTTNYWLKIAIENLANSKSTIICGSSVPDEIYSSPLYIRSLNILFGLLKINESSIQERLSKRNWDQFTIDDYKIWQKALEVAVKQTKNHCIINGEHSEESLIEDITNWLLKSKK